MVELQFKNNDTGVVRIVTADTPIESTALSDPALAKLFNDPEGTTYSTVSGRPIPLLEVERYNFYNKKNIDGIIRNNKQISPLKAEKYNFYNKKNL